MKISEARQSGSRPVRLFQSDLLERFTRISIVSLVLFWLPISLGAIALGVALSSFTASVNAGIVLAGLAVWSPFEYALHRLIFHLDRVFPSAASFCFLIHGCHHADPSDAGRDIMPLVGSVPIGLGILAVAILCFGEAAGLMFGGGFGLGYLTYDVAHYGCHQWRMPGRLGASIKRYHLAHHYADDTRHFGVTSPLWDWVFGTLRLAPRHG
jgi:sterol desaturase/sphingolipid hydroxylase (fatty acid hydroxylase superfamily)